jgi:hypothetical protein
MRRTQLMATVVLTCAAMDATAGSASALDQPTGTLHTRVRQGAAVGARCADH